MTYLKRPTGMILLVEDGLNFSRDSLGRENIPVISRSLNVNETQSPIQAVDRGKIDEALKMGTIKIRDQKLFKEFLQMHEQFCGKS